tara:strand:- start:1259 stop:1696 length:438 start_codon:yes stop_codon:yes gene_type:complete
VDVILFKHLVDDNSVNITIIILFKEIQNLSMKYQTRLLFFISLCTVFYLSLVPSSNIPNFASLSLISDKLVHALIYFYLAYIGLLCRFGISKITIVLLIFGIGLIIEIIHHFHPYRLFEYLDLLANLIGVTIALLIFRIKNNISY